MRRKKVLLSQLSRPREAHHLFFSISSCGFLVHVHDPRRNWNSAHGDFVSNRWSGQGIRALLHSHELSNFSHQACCWMAAHSRRLRGAVSAASRFRSSFPTCVSHSSSSCWCCRRFSPDLAIALECALKTCFRRSWMPALRVASWRLSKGTIPFC